MMIGTRRWVTLRIRWGFLGRRAPFKTVGVIYGSYQGYFRMGVTRVVWGYAEFGVPDDMRLL